jgi:hypothetical protein
MSIHGGCAVGVVNFIDEWISAPYQAGGRTRHHLSG